MPGTLAWAGIGWDWFPSLPLRRSATGRGRMEDDREPGVDESLLAVVAYDRPPGERIGPVDVGERERQVPRAGESGRKRDGSAIGNMGKQKSRLT